MVKDAFATCKADCTWQSGYLAPQVFLGCITELPVVVQLVYLRYKLCRVSCLVDTVRYRRVFLPLRSSPVLYIGRALGPLISFFL